MTFMAQAAPFPAATSVFSRPQTGLFWRSKGFSLPTAGTAWQLQTPDTENSVEKEAQAILSSGTFIQKRFPKARFSVNVEHVKGVSTVEAYSKKWVKEYYQYGFDVLRSKPFKQNDEIGLVYDLRARQKSVQVRQVIFLKNKTAVTLTCTDDTRSFSQSVADCDRLIKNFRWE